MLKLQKGRKFLLHLSAKESILTRNFLQAFAIALILHATAFFLFTIRPLITKGIKPSSHPAHVEAEITDSVYSSSSHSIGIESDQKRVKRLYPLPVSTPNDFHNIFILPEASADYLLSEIELKDIE